MLVDEEAWLFFCFESGDFDDIPFDLWPVRNEPFELSFFLQFWKVPLDELYDPFLVEATLTLGYSLSLFFVRKLIS